MCQPGRPWPPGGFPAGFSGFGPLPQGEIKGMTLAAFLSISGSTAGSLLLVVGVAAAELAVILGLRNVEVDITI